MLEKMLDQLGEAEMAVYADTGRLPFCVPAGMLPPEQHGWGMDQTIAVDGGRRLLARMSMSPDERRASGLSAWYIDQPALIRTQDEC